jgi:phosphoribosyl-AMP cyclohydrolase / phosphoribosyl-ATP pyrophosphohydrolase
MIHIEYNKYPDGLVPVIVQDATTNVVLMLGFMNKAALDKTYELGKVTFFSRSKQRLWTKGEESGNFLLFKEMLVDCDKDTLLVKAEPVGPVCHTGAATCFGEDNRPAGFLHRLEAIIADRKANPSDSSYTASLFAKGINKIAQKVGEEAVELVIEAKDDNGELFKNEAADLLFHYMVLLRAKGYTFADVEAVLMGRHG